MHSHKKETDARRISSYSSHANQTRYIETTFEKDFWMSLGEAGIDFSLVSEKTTKLIQIEKPDQYTSPFSWSIPKKSRILTITCASSFLAAYSAGSYAMVSEVLQAKWQLSNVAVNLGITMFVMGFGFAPVAGAPFSERRGRYPVFIAAGVVFLAGTIGCAVTNSFAGMLVCRFITGCGSSIFATLVGGVVSDIFHNESRNIPMALYSLAVMLGTALGPLISGYVASGLSWRWVFHLQSIFISCEILLLVFGFDETRQNVILERKAAAHTKLYRKIIQGLQLKEGDFGPSSIELCFHAYLSSKPDHGILSTMLSSFRFSLKLLVTESVIFWFSVWISFAWAILYMQFSSIELIFRTRYAFTNTQVGTVYSAVAAASLFYCVLNIVLNQILSWYFKSLTAVPESRLYFSCIESAALPAGLFLFGWGSWSHDNWIVPAFAIGLCTFGIFSIYLAVFHYLSDIYHRYASSALAAQSMCRNLLAGIFPLLTRPMFVNLGFNWAGTLLGIIGLLLTAVPWVLCFYGPIIRARSPFAKEIMQA